MATHTMNAERRVRRAAWINSVVFAAVVGTSCSSAASGEGDDSEPDEQITMARNLSDTKQPFRDAFDELVVSGLTPLVGTADFAPCDDETDLAFVPTLTGQLRYTDGRSPAEGDANQLRDVLVAAGWGLDESEPFVDGMTATPEGWEVGLFGYEFNDVALRVVLRRDAPEVDVTATGVCLPATAEEQQFYDAMGTWYLNAIVPHATSPDTTASSS